MAETSNGANGAFSGKVGSVVGSSWRAINYIRGIGKRSGKAPSQAQVEQQIKFRVMIKFLEQIKDLLSKGFAGVKSDRATGYNMAVQYNLRNAITGTSPEFQVDYERVLLTKGGLGKPAVAGMTKEGPGSVKVTWDPTNNQFNAYDSDIATVILYNTAKNLFVSNSKAAATRVAGELVMDVPLSYTGDQLVGYIYFTSTEKGRLSESMFLGTLTMTS